MAEDNNITNTKIISKSKSLRLLKRDVFDYGLGVVSAIGIDSTSAATKSTSSPTNSDDEKKVFSKNLNSKDFEFVELVREILQVRAQM